MVGKSKHALSEDIILISRGVAIYKTGASPYWQCRIRDAQSKRYVVRSTKETSRIKAREAARELADEIRSREKVVERAFTFDHYARRTIAKAERMVAGGERNANYARDIRYCLENKEWGLLKFLGARMCEKYAPVNIRNAWTPCCGSALTYQRPLETF